MMLFSNFYVEMPEENYIFTLKSIILYPTGAGVSIGLLIEIFFVIYTENWLLIPTTDEESSLPSLLTKSQKNNGFMREKKSFFHSGSDGSLKFLQR